MGRGEWILHLDNDLNHEEYKQLAETFTTETFDGRGIASLASEAGMNYIVLTGTANLAKQSGGFDSYRS